MDRGSPPAPPEEQTVFVSNSLLKVGAEEAEGGSGAGGGRGGLLPRFHRSLRRCSLIVVQDSGRHGSAPQRLSQTKPASPKRFQVLLNSPVWSKKRRVQSSGRAKLPDFTHNLLHAEAEVSWTSWCHVTGRQAHS